METNNLVRNYAAKAAQTALFRSVYLWMTLALVITGFVAMYVAKSYALISMIAQNSIMFWGILIAELGLVMYMSARINRISFTTATLLFIAYSVLNGVTMSILFMVYTLSSIATTFFVTAGTFGAMALFGYVTKKDLTRIGSLCIMGVIGLIIASVVNLFLQNSMMDMIISYVGVLLFVGLTAYDSQKIKQLLGGDDIEVNETTQKIALMGALTLYLDFINLFIYLGCLCWGSGAASRTSSGVCTGICPRISVPTDVLLILFTMLSKSVTLSSLNTSNGSFCS